jgi:hypothetical protein
VAQRRKVVRERLARDELHCQERKPLPSSRVVNRNDVFVLQGGERLHLTLETGAEAVVVRPAGVDDLQRDDAIRGEVKRLEYGSHPALRDDAEHVEPGNSRQISHQEGLDDVRVDCGWLIRAGCGAGEGCGGIDWIGIGSFGRPHVK